MKKQLIVTADDYGMCDAVNEAIDECLEAGGLGATCVMTNMTELDAVPGLRRRFPHASIGLHWTLTQGRPLLPARLIPTILNEDGTFLGFAELRRRLLRRQVKLDHIRAELVAQYVRFFKLVGRPDFWNTHMGIHVFPGIFPVCTALGRELGIPAMRSHRRITVPRHDSVARFHRRHPLYWLKGRIVAAWSADVERRGTKMPDGTITLSGFPNGIAGIEEVVEHIDWRQAPRAAEYIVHPATRIYPELFGKMTDSRLREYATFRDPDLHKRLGHRGIKIVGFEVL